MGLFSDFFSSPRERQGPQSFQQLLSEINGMNDSFGGINDVGGVRSKFGLGGVKDLYGGAKRNLATRLAQSRSSASSRMSNSVATPESIFTGIESSFAPAFGELEDKQAQAEVGDQRYVAQLLASIFGEQNQFGFNKMGLKRGATSDYINSLSNASGFDDLMSLIGTGAKAYGAVTGIPKLSGGGGGGGMGYGTGT